MLLHDAHLLLSIRHYEGEPAQTHGWHKFVCMLVLVPSIDPLIRSIRYAVCVGKTALSVRLLGRCRRFWETTLLFYGSQQKDNQIEISRQTGDNAH